MKWLRGLSYGQRVVLVVALGVGLGSLGSYLVTLGSPSSGWVAYAPLTEHTGVPGIGLHPWVRLLIWLALTVVWATCSLVLLRPSSSTE